MNLIKAKALTEAQEFHKKFNKKNKSSFTLKTDTLGNILSVQTDDNKIIAYLKKIGLDENEEA